MAPAIRAPYMDAQKKARYRDRIKDMSPLEQIRYHGKILHAVRETRVTPAPYGVHHAYRKR